MLTRQGTICRATHSELAVAHVPDGNRACQRHSVVTDGEVERRRPNLRIFLVIAPERRKEIARQLAPLKARLVFAGPSGDTEDPIREDDVFQVAILPATLSDTAWWKLWGILGLLNPRPAILVYAREATFQLWSGVLESGGYDVIVDPFSDRKIREAVLRAAKNFDERLCNGV